jgi:hypothetical protein
MGDLRVAGRWRRRSHCLFVGKLRKALEAVEKRREYLERRLDRQVAMAVQYAKAGKKAEAIRCIKGKKMFESELHRNMARITQLETQLEEMQMHQAATSPPPTCHVAGADEHGRGGLAQDVQAPGVEADDDALAAELEAMMQSGGRRGRCARNVEKELAELELDLEGSMAMQ